MRAARASFFALGWLVALLLAAMMGSCQGLLHFSPLRTSRLASHRGRTLRDHSSGSGGSPLDRFKAKRAADPNYDPLNDPEFMQSLESLVPDELREVYNAMNRLQTAVTEANSRAEGMDDYDQRVSALNKLDLVSSPQSEWFKSGMPTEMPNEETLQKLREEMKAKYPQIPFPE